MDDINSKSYITLGGLRKSEIPSPEQPFWLDNQSRLKQNQKELEAFQSKLKQNQKELEAFQSQLKQNQKRLKCSSLDISSSIRVTLEQPQIWQCKTDNIIFSGWCFQDFHKIEKLILQCGYITKECTYGFSRDDVHQAYPNSIFSKDSGFIASINVPQGNWKVSLKAYFKTGEIISVDAPDILVVKYPQPWEKILKEYQYFYEKNKKFVYSVKRKARERYLRLGRYPSLQELPELIHKSLELYQTQYQKSSQQTSLPKNFLIPSPIDPYDAWLMVNQWNERSKNNLRLRLRQSQSKPIVISIVMPVFNTQVEFLEKAISSVVNQVYENWELCIADDNSSDRQIHSVLKKWMSKDDRIKVVFREKNGNISLATNSAANLANGEFLLFLDHDDELTPDALGEIALYLSEHPETDFLYSDDDKIDIEGKRFAPQFKPDWSPQLLLSYMYMSHVCVVRNSIFKQVGGMRVGFEGSQDYDFALRATEICRQVAHLPLVLYHWRAVPGSTAVSGKEKPKSFIAGQQAVQEAFERRGILGNVYQPKWALESGLGIFDGQFPDTGPSVTIIIPTKNGLNLLKPCLESLEKTTYQNYQIVVIDNESDDPKILAYLETINHQVLHIKNPNNKFNFAAINNRAVEQVESDYVLFLNNDTEVFEPRWLSQMVGYAQLDRVGAVGAKLLYPDRRVQHAGVIHGLNHGLAGHAFKLIPAKEYGYLCYAKVPRNYSAVTAACMLTPRDLFLKLGGFDEANFAVAYNDVDYCYRLIEAKYYCVYCPSAELIHKEGTTRGYVDNPQEAAALRSKYARKIDRFYSPHLSLEDEQFKIQPRRLLMGKIDRPLRILICTHTLDLTGAPLHQYEITLELAQRRAIEPIVFSFADGHLRSDYEKHNIKVIICEQHPLSGIYQAESYQKAIEQLSDRLSELNIDLLYANTLETFLMVDCAQKMGIPCIWNVHESEPWQTYFKRFSSEIESLALNCFSIPYKVIFVADATKNRYLDLNSNHNFAVIHNGIHRKKLEMMASSWTKKTARESLKINDSEIVILLLGTVCERKGQHDLPRSLAMFPAELFSKIKVFIVGDRPSPYSEELKQLVASLPPELSQKITIVPEVKDTARYYQATDIFVFTSRIESFPRVILEAMAYGLPIITTPVFGVVEQVKPNVNAMFYNPGDIETLAKAIQNLIENDELRSRLASNSPYILNCLNSFEEMVQNYNEIFQEAYLTIDARSTKLKNF